MDVSNKQLEESRALRKSDLVFLWHNAESNFPRSCHCSHCVKTDTKYTSGIENRNDIEVGTVIFIPGA